MSGGIYAHIVGYEDTHARDKYRDRVNSCHRRSDDGAQTKDKFWLFHNGNSFLWRVQILLQKAFVVY